MRKIRNIFLFWLVSVVSLLLGCQQFQTTGNFNVSFLSDGETVAIEVVQYGSLVTAPDDVTKEGYTLKGWFCDNDEWRFKIDVVTKDIVLEAKWEEIDKTAPKVEPIYQGMSIVGEQSPQKEKRAPNQNNIDNILTDIFEVEDSDGIEYYADKNEKYKIVVHIYNPSNFEILSFTLNNYKYQSFEFFEGSNSSQLIIEVDAGNISGLKEYTIDGIKYVDGTEIKDVKMDGNKTIKAGVRYDIVPNATVNDEMIGTTSIKSAIEIKDELKLNSGLYYIFYDGTSILKNEPLQLGQNIIEVDALQMGKNYEYAVVGIYNDYSKAGKRAVVLASNNFNTLNGIEIDTISSTHDEVSITTLVNSNDATIDNVSIYLNDELISTGTDLTFTNLLSNKTYKVVLTYKYQIGDNSYSCLAEKEITTNNYATPSIEMMTKVLRDNISYDILVNDVDSVMIINAVKLYQENILIETKTTLKDSFSNLLPNTQYTIVVEYKYDLNEGQGITEIKQVFDTKTMKIKPKVEVVPFIITQNNINFVVNVTDFGTGCEITTVGLYKDKTLVQRLVDLTQREFYGLTPYSDYEIRITYQYDLDDGLGKVSETYIFNFNTLKNDPIITYNDVTSSQSSISFNVTIDDVHQAGSVSAYNLYYQGELVQTITPNISNPEMSVMFDNLYSNSSYRLEIVYTYDLSDGEGERTKTELYYINTLVKETPTVSIDNIILGYSDISFQVNEIDNDNIGVQYTNVGIYDCNDLVASTTISDLNFKSLLSNHIYNIKLTYEYDLNDNRGIQTRTISETVRTNAYQVPTLELVDENVRFNFITFKVESNDTFLLFKEVISANLYYNGELVSTLENQEEYTFTNLLTNANYEVEVVYSYNLRDGFGDQTRRITKTYTTPSKEVPSLEFINTSSTQTTISWDYNIKDIDNVGEITKVTVNGEEIDINIKTLDNLNSAFKYVIKVTYTYDQDDGNGNQEIEFTKAIVTQTEQVSVTSLEVLNTETITSGQEVQVKVYLDNPSNLIIDAFYVNGKQTDVLAQINDYAILKFTPDVKGGRYEIVLSSITYTLLDETLEMVMDSEHRSEIVILGDFEIVDFYFKDDYTTVHSYLIPESPVMQYDGISAVLVLEVNNPFGYDIQKVDIQAGKRNEYNYDYYDYYYEYSFKSFTKIDDNHYEFVLGDQYDFGSTIFESTSLSVILNSLTYGIGEINKEIIPSEIPSEIPVEISDEIIVLSDELQPVLVYTVEDLMKMRGERVFSLQNDIDLNGVSWEPYRFSGILEGNNHTISNLTIFNNNKVANIGMFTTVSSGSTIRDLYIDNAYVSTNSIYSGIMCGELSGTIENCSVSGYISSSRDDLYDGGQNVGGFVGSNSGRILKCNSSVEVISFSSIVAIFSGGFAGSNSGTISGSYATGSVSIGSEPIFAGGFIGYNSGTISGSYATGNVSGSLAGGFVLENTGTISGCYATGSVSGGSTNGAVGGFVTYNNGTIFDSYATGSVSVDDPSGSAGGFAYCNTETISDSYAAGDVSGSYVGGFVVENYGTISGSYANGNVSGSGAGGFAYQNSGVIFDSYATGNVSGVSSGGFVYKNNYSGTISDCYASGDVSGSCVGGFAYQLDGSLGTSSISNCYATGNVAGGYSFNLGGFAYFVHDNVVIVDCYAAGNILSVDGYSGCGFISRIEDNVSIKNCFTISNNGEDVYLNFTNSLSDSSTITNCYSLAVDSYTTQLESTEQILTELNKVWDTNIWDFENLTEVGTPTLK